jgi:hypothetical protein
MGGIVSQFGGERTIFMSGATNMLVMSVYGEQMKSRSRRYGIVN